MINGLDVSNWQPKQFSLDLPESGLLADFVIIQVTRGFDGINERWKDQAAWARQHGLAVGFYHFGAAGGVESQADRFVDTVTPLWPGETLWYDWETSHNTAPTNAEKDAFIKRVKGKLPGRKVGLYCNAHFWKNVDTTSYCGDGLWIAHYDVPEPAIEADWVIHQYSNAFSVDRNRADFESREAMKVWGGKQPTPEHGLMRDVRSLSAAYIAHSVQVEVALAALNDLWALEAVTQGKRHDALKSAVDQILTVLEYDPAVGDIARGVADELARRLTES